MQGRTPYRIASFLLELIYPALCPVCGARAATHSIAPICPACWDAIARLRGAHCIICAKPLMSVGAHTCLECMADPPAFDEVRCFGPYGGPMAAAIKEYKFTGIRRLARPLAALLASMPVDADGIVPVPMTKAALLSRGFSQTALLGRELGRIAGVPLWTDALIKTRETLPQVGLTRAARIENVQGAFQATPAVKGKRLILLDDVITTTTTMRECSRALRRAGAASVVAMALARTDAIRVEAPGAKLIA